MSFSISLNELGELFQLSLEKDYSEATLKASCSGITTAPSSVDAGYCYVHLSGSDTLENDVRSSIARGASFVLIDEVISDVEFLTEFSNEIPIISIKKLNKNFWKLISRWRAQLDSHLSSESSKVFSEIVYIDSCTVNSKSKESSPPLHDIVLALTSSVLLQKMPGRVAGAFSEISEEEIACRVVNSADSAEWFCWVREEGQKQLGESLQPDFSLDCAKETLSSSKENGDGDIEISPLKDSHFEYVGEGKFLFSSKAFQLPLLSLPLPIIGKGALFAFTLCSELCSKSQRLLEKEEFDSCLERFITPSWLGELIEIGEDCFFWIGEGEGLLAEEISVLSRSVESLGIIIGGRIDQEQLRQEQFRGDPLGGFSAIVDECKDNSAITLAIVGNLNTQNQQDTIENALILRCSTLDEAISGLLEKGCRFILSSQHVLRSLGKDAYSFERPDLFSYQIEELSKT